MRNYRKIKLQLFSRMTEGDVGIIPEEMMNSNGRPLFESRHNRWISFGTSDAADFRYVNGMVVWKDGMVSLRRTIFENEALGTSAAAAAAAVDACGLNCSHVESAARRFRPLPHRICDIGVLNGVRFVDDSKSTNMSAVVAALKAVRAPVYLIAGGRSKADDYERVRPLIAEKVVRAYLIGEAAETMHAAWSDSVSCLICRTLQNAVEAAFDSALPGSTILLSPGCSSADQFRDYRMRGKVFEECMAGLKKESKKKT